MFKLETCLSLADGDVLERDSSFDRLNLGQEEVREFLVKNVAGEVVGRVRHVCHTSLRRPFRVTHSVTQIGIHGEVIRNIKC
jgi:hypothetical protein